MSAIERDRLPHEYPGEIGQYVNAIVRHARSHLVDFGNDLKKAVVGTFAENVHGERFILDSAKTSSLNTFCLFIDSEGELVTVRDADVDFVPLAGSRLSQLVLKSYQSYEVITGPRTGQVFARYARPLPAEPELRLRPNAFSSISVQAPVAMPSARRLRVFLCHASEDKSPVRDLKRRLESWGHQPWLDEEQILPGQDWDREIRHGMSDAHIVLVCLSPRSEKRGYVQKELRRALDIADEQPDGSIYIIPLKLEPCSVPERLRRWQWVELFSDGGERRLQMALEAAAQAVPESEVSA